MWMKYRMERRHLDDGLPTTRWIRSSCTYSTYEEAAELASLGLKSCILFQCNLLFLRISAWAKNSYNPSALGTIITARDMSNFLSPPSLKEQHWNYWYNQYTYAGTYGFLSNVFRVFEECKVSVDVVVDISVSVTIDKKNTLPRKYSQTLDQVAKLCWASILKERCIVSIISNLERSSLITALESWRDSVSSAKCYHRVQVR